MACGPSSSSGLTLKTDKAVRLRNTYNRGSIHRLCRSLIPMSGSYSHPSSPQKRITATSEALPDVEAMLTEVLAYAIELCGARGGRLSLERSSLWGEALAITQGETNSK